MKLLKIVYVALNLVFAQSLFASDSTKKQGTPFIEMSGKLPDGTTQELKTYTITNETNTKGNPLIKKIASELSQVPEPQIISVVSDDKKTVEKVDSITKEIKGEVKSSNLVELKTVINEKIKDKYAQSAEFFKKHERISLTIARTVINGTTSSVGLLINGGLPPVTAFSLGFFSGAFSGLFQYYNPQFQSLIDGNPEKNKLVAETKKFGAVRVKTYQMTRWFLTEVSIYALIKTFSYAIGAPTSSFSTEAMKVLKSSAMATASQGLWDSTIATETKVDLRRNEGNEAAQRRIQGISNVKTFAVSMVSVFGGILTLMGAPLGNWTLGILGATGIVYTYRAWKNNKLSIEMNSPRYNFLLSNCRSLFN